MEETSRSRFPQNLNINATPLQIAVDYTKPLESVFTELAMAIMHTCGAYAILTATGTFGKATDHDLKLPSWVPDFRRPLECHLVRDIHLQAACPGVGFLVDHERSLRAFCRLNPDFESNALRLDGCQFATISQNLDAPFSPEEERKILSVRETERVYCYCDSHQSEGLADLNLKFMDTRHLDPIERVNGKGIDIGVGRAGFSTRWIAIPKEAAVGDIMAFVMTVPFPIILRGIPGNAGRFIFVGAVWLLEEHYHSITDPVGYNFTKGYTMYDAEHGKETFLVI